MAPPYVLPSALDAIGSTPLIQLNRIPQSEGLECNIFVKAEYFNAGGSVKDRIARRMILDAETRGVLVPGGDFTVVEPTSGNTGVGLALACAIRGYKCIIVLPEKMSQEKINTLRALGAQVIRTPTDAAFDDPRSHMSVAARIVRENERHVMLDQYNNRNNPDAHHDETAKEIVEALANTYGAPAATSAKRAVGQAEQDSIVKRDGILTPAQTPEGSPPVRIGSHLVEGNFPSQPSRTFSTAVPSASSTKAEPAPSAASSASIASRMNSPLVDVLVAGVGTGGTITGIATRLKSSDHNPSCFVVGVDPVGSTLALPSSLNELEQGESAIYKVEGIGYDFDIAVLNKNKVDRWIKTRDDESFAWTRKLIAMEGLLCGGSSGAAMEGAMRFLKDKGEHGGWSRFGGRKGVNVVVVLPDGIRNYISKDWLVQGAPEPTKPE